MSTCINSLCLPSQLQLYTTKGKERISSLSEHPPTHNIQYSIKSFRKGKHLSLFPLYFLHLLSSPGTSSSSHLNKAGVLPSSSCRPPLFPSQMSAKTFVHLHKSLSETLMADPFIVSALFSRTSLVLSSSRSSVVSQACHRRKWSSLVTV